MKVVILGAGLLGVASAWYLAEDGHEVTVLDRQAEAGMETSFANGGQISSCHAAPWANPSAPWQIAKWLRREDSPLLWRLRADPAQWAWGMRFLVECSAARARQNTIDILRLALYSREKLGTLRQQLDLEYDQLKRGILHFYTDEREFLLATSQAALMREFGCERVTKEAEECLALEPALKTTTVPIVGGTYTAEDESGDAHKFTQALAQRCKQAGVSFLFGEAIDALGEKSDRIANVRLANGTTLTGDAFVVALGSWSPLLLKSAGVTIPVYPAKGYSVTVPLDADSIAPTISLTDDSHKIVISRLANRLRVAGTAEFAGYDRSINAVRCNAILRRLRAVFPGVVHGDRFDVWAGLRPATPSNVPFVGKAKFDNLFLNTGHGTLGWTMACGSGQLIADLIAGRAPDVDPAPYAF
ncbi:MAG TPA: D-amino acid dehydrogenase [Rhodocyclaceae bacterium]|nr:D-amino acid dehydrogenase [Rhodocyclaceae bacterium]